MASVHGDLMDRSTRGRLEQPPNNMKIAFPIYIWYRWRSVISDKGNIKSICLLITLAILLITVFYLSIQYSNTLIAMLEILNYLVLNPLSQSPAVFRAIIERVDPKQPPPLSWNDEDIPRESEKSVQKSSRNKKDDPISRATGDTIGPLGSNVPNPVAVTCFTKAGSQATQMVPISLKDVNNDEEFIQTLQKYYKAFTVSNYWFPFFMEVRDIKFVKIRVSEGVVTDLWMDSLPPDYRTDYEFFPRPVTRFPPFSNELFLCAWHRSHHIFSDLRLMLDMVPKLRHPQFSDSEEQWGICVVDELNPRFFDCTLLLTFGITVILLIAVESDILDGQYHLSHFITALIILTPLILVMVIFFFAIYLEDDGRLFPSIGSVPENEPESGRLAVIQSRLERLRMSTSVILSLSIPKLRQYFAIWQTVADRVLLGFRMQDRTSCHCGFKFRGTWHSLENGSSNETILDHRDLEPQDGTRYPPLLEKSPPVHRTINDRNGNSQQLANNDIPPSSLGTNPSSSGGNSSGSSNAHATSGQNSSESFSNNSSAGGNDGSGDNGEGNNPFADSRTNSPPSHSTGEYLHLILLDRSYGKKQVVVDISSSTTDCDVFIKLNETYRQQRGSWRALTCVRSLRLTKYRLFSPRKCHTLFDPKDLWTTMPDEENTDFAFSYTPEDEGWEPPIIADDILWHFFCHPRGSINDGVPDIECRNRLPKRLSPLTYSPNEGYPVGWGVEVVEGFNWRLFYHCESLIVVIALVVTLIYLICSQDESKVSTAFTIGQWILGAGQLFYVVVLALSEAFSFWRY